MEPTVATNQLTKAYEDVVAVDGLDLELQPGEVFGLLGPNGAGKTTTILMLLGLSEPTSGSARVLGLDPRRNPLEVKRQVGYLPDSVGFYDGMSGRENLRFTAALNRLDKKSLPQQIEAVLEEVGLAATADRPAGTYSRGMLQRLGIADALLKEPRVLILDEPTTSIDPEGVQDVLALIRRLAEERRVTVLLASHLLHQVQTVCDRVAIFVAGKVVIEGAPHHLAGQAEGPERVELATEGAKPPSALLEGLDFVHEVQAGRLPGHYEVSIERGTTSRLVHALVSSGVAVTGIRRSSEDLDDVYRAYFDRAGRDA